MHAINLQRLRPDQRARLAAIEASGLDQPGMRLFAETLDLPRTCRSRPCMRAKACVGEKLRCLRDNREFLLNEVLPQMMGERDAGG